jgi:predicted nucleotidyltransferase component of viral defense system
VLDEKEIIKKGRSLGINNIGFIAKDYINEILLYLISQKFNNLIFKGETALFKFFGLPRFSEDLDFTIIGKINLKQLENQIKKLKNWGFNFDYKSTEKEKSIKILIKVKDFIVRNIALKLEIDLSKREEVFNYKPLMYFGNYENLSFVINVMQEKEILAEKVRAIISRNRARDVFDLWFLLNKNAEIDLKLINKKLSIYGLEFNKEDFYLAIKKKEKIWKEEIKPLLLNKNFFVDFEQVFMQIKDKF